MPFWAGARRQSRARREYASLRFGVDTERPCCLSGLRTEALADPGRAQALLTSQGDSKKIMNYFMTLPAENLQIMWRRAKHYNVVAEWQLRD